MLMPTNMDEYFQKAEIGSGYAADVPFGPGDLLNAAGIHLTSATTPDVLLVSSAHVAAKWDHGDLVTDVALLAFVMPQHYAEDRKGLQIIVRARKVDADDVENPDLKLMAQVRWTNPGAAEVVQSLTTAATALMSAAVAGVTTAGFADYTLDIGARLRAESKTIKAGASVTIEIGPHETVGTTDIDLQVIGGVIRMLRHVNHITHATRSFGTN